MFIANLCLAPTRVMLPGYHTGNVGTNCEGFFYASSGVLSLLDLSDELSRIA